MTPQRSKTVAKRYWCDGGVFTDTPTEKQRAELTAWVDGAAYDRELDTACGALADIAFSDDMTLELARAKAKRIYEKLRNG